MKIAITGGGGYVGSALVPHLLAQGHEVTVLDTFWYGDHLPHTNSSLKKIIGDIRIPFDLRRAFKGQDAVIHLACVSNDPSFALNPKLGKSINLDAFKEIIRALQEQNVARFIYASSSSVYGVSDSPNVSEETAKNPLTDYSKYKLGCEVLLKQFGTGGIWTILRPATVCGYAPRQRLDVIVNALTANAVVKKQMKITSRNNLRPNINIQDMVLAYDFVLNKEPKYVDQKIWNVGFENISLLQIANMVKSVVGGKIPIYEELDNDPRSYHINSDKILDAGFKPKHSIKDAIKSLKTAIDDGKLFDPLNNPQYFNVKQMEKMGFA